jgi:hypothetical protein
VKITVIATGFRDVARTQHRPIEVHQSFASRHEDAMDFPEPLGPAQPDPVFPGSEMTMQEAPVMEPVAHASPEVISLDTMRTAMVANFEQDDLDVPAFMRKRGEVM